MEFGDAESKLNWIEHSNIEMTILDCEGDKFKEVYDKIKKITSFQFMEERKKGIKGFILHGVVGCGKTTLAKVLAKAMRVPLLFIDGSDVAMELYGQSEKKIKQIFDEAKKKKCIILIDDAETVFPDREWSKGQSWHSAQNNQLLHHLDCIDTSKNMVIMTTNKYNLLDMALKDRLYPIEFETLDKETLEKIIKKKCEDYDLEYEDVKGSIKVGESIRAIEKMLEEKYIEKITGVGGSNPVGERK